ncbi:MAG TPA: AtzH-like domain-containing protein [Steroidobacteraceae bacterium]|nr:AtzH-like domain-containing protein [Steroidobacteraceae bacterium]
MKDAGASTWRETAETEVRQQFDRYEQALRAHAIDALNDFFVDAPESTRFGIDEENYGRAAIDDYRRGCKPVHPHRHLRRSVVVALTPQVVCVSSEFTDPDTIGIGRQSQTWLSTPRGWKIAMAHVSVRRDPVR